MEKNSFYHHAVLVRVCLFATELILSSYSFGSCLQQDWFYHHAVLIHVCLPKSCLVGTAWRYQPGRAFKFASIPLFTLLPCLWERLERSRKKLAHLPLFFFSLVGEPCSYLLFFLIIIFWPNSNLKADFSIYSTPTLSYFEISNFTRHTLTILHQG